MAHFMSNKMSLKSDLKDAKCDFYNETQIWR